MQTDSTKLYFCVSDARTYAHYLFNAFDTTNNGSIKFKVKECFHIYSHSHLFSDPLTLSFNLTRSFAERTLSWGCLSCCVGHLRKSWSGHFTFMTLTRTDTSTERRGSTFTNYLSICLFIYLAIYLFLSFFLSFRR